MFENVPTDDGVPESVPVEVLKLAQDGLFWIVKVSVSPSASLPVGWKLYAWPAVTEVVGEPEMVGGRFVGGAAVTAIENAVSEALA